MPRRPTHPPLAVFMNGRRVGTLSRAANGAIDFRYAEAWLAWENAIPVSLSLPLREDRYVGAPVMAVFDNLLPDAEPIRRRVAERVGASGIDAHSLLAALGQDCVGALQFLTEDTEPGPVGAVEGRPVSDRDRGIVAPSWSCPARGRRGSRFPDFGCGRAGKDGVAAP